MKGIIRNRSFWVGAILASAVALVVGVASAQTPQRATLQLCVDNASIRVDTGDGCKSKEERIEVYTKGGVDAAILAAIPNAGDAETLDGLDSTAFLQTGSAIDASTLDGLDSTAFAQAAHSHDDRYYTKASADSTFLLQGAKAADADQIDGLDSTAFVRKVTLTQNLDEFSIAAGSCATDSITPIVPLSLGTTLLNTFNAGLPVGVFVRGTRISPENMIEMEYCNITSAAITVPNTVLAEFVDLR